MVTSKKPPEGWSREQFARKFGKKIEEYESFKRAIETLKSSRNYLNILPRYFLYLEEDPDMVIANRRADIANPDVVMNERYERKTKAYVKLLEKENLSVGGHLSRIQGFFSNNSSRLSLDLKKLKYSKANKTRKYSPSNEDVRKLYGQAEIARNEFIVAVMYQHGPAPIDVSRLRIGDYPLEPWTYFELSRSKTGEVWRGVSTPDACDCLKRYMMVRRGQLKERLLVGREGALDSESVSAIVARLIEKAGLDTIEGFVPKCLRDGFEDALADARIYSKVKEALMGHTADIAHRYGGYKKMVERLTQAMKKVYPLICLTDQRETEARLQEFSNVELRELHEILRERAMKKLQNKSL